MQTVVDTSYFIEFIGSPFEKKFQWMLDSKLITTTLFVYEFHNVLLKTLKISPQDLHKFHNILNEMYISFKNVKKYESEIYTLSFERNLSFYDASYLWLSLNNKTPIATYDKEIIRTANDLKIDVIE